MMGIVNKTKMVAKEILFRFKLKRVYAADSKYQLRYLRGQCKDSEDKLDADIMLVMHALEKGMSFPVKKKGFGKEKSTALVDMLNDHISRYGVNRQVIVATNILHSYLQDPFSVEESKARNKVQDYLSSHSDLLSNSL